MDGKEVEERRKGPWTAEEDKLLCETVKVHGEGRWSCVATASGLKRGHLTPQEKGIIIELHALWGNKWSTIARYLPGRTDDQIKNYWRTHLKKMKQKRKAQIIAPKADNKTLPPITSSEHAKELMTPCEERFNDLGMGFTEPAAMGNDQSYLSMVYQDFAAWESEEEEAAAAVQEEERLWGGLWEVPKNDLINYWENVEE